MDNKNDDPDHKAFVRTYVHRNKRISINKAPFRALTNRSETRIVKIVRYNKLLEHSFDSTKIDNALAVTSYF